VKSIKLLLLTIVSVLSVAVAVSPSAFAANDGCRSSFFGIPVWYKYLNLDDDCNIVTDKQQNVAAKIILGIIDIALFLAGLLAVIMILWGGFQFIFANGEPGSIANARKTILNAVIGLIIAILASQIVRFVAYLLSR
jgi:hypothetical protein